MKITMILCTLILTAGAVICTQAHRYTLTLGSSGGLLFRFDTRTGTTWKTMYGEGRWVQVMEPLPAFDPAKPFKVETAEQFLDSTDQFGGVKIPDWAQTNPPPK
jgi:hypothetical protein